MKKTSVKGPSTPDGEAEVAEGRAVEFSGVKPDAGEKPDAKPEDKASAEAKPDDIDGAINEFKKSLGYYPEEKKEEAKKEEPEKKEDEKSTDKAAEAKPDEKPEDKEDGAEEKPSKRRPVQGGLSVDEAEGLIRSAADAAADAAVRASRPQAEAAEKETSDPAASLTDDDRVEYEAFKQLEKDNPKYKGAAAQYLKFLGEFDRYRTTWEKDHPDEAFDPDSKDHDTFYDRHQPKYNARELEAAKINRVVEERLKTREDEISKRQVALEAKVAEYELKPEIDKQANTAIQAMVGEVDPEAAKLLAKGPEALQEEDPIAFDILDEAAVSLRMMVGELSKLTHKSGLFRFDPRNNLHVHLDQFAQGLEADIRRRPLEDRVRDGRTFVTKREYDSLPESKRANYWVLDGPTIREELVKAVAKDAQARIAKEKARIQKYTKGATKSPPAEEKKAAEKTTTTERKPNSPAAASEAITKPAMTHDSAPAAGTAKVLMDSLFPA